MNCNYKSLMSKKKAFTLIELLIVIAIIGILFIVLVSKVDFATDKAKATGVQTDFRSFQMAFEAVSKENAGFNSFGWNTGDANANGVRDSVDEGDTNKDGIYQNGETWTGHKKYLETWTDKYSLIKPGTTFDEAGYDKDAIFALETAINKNLDPKLHISIDAKTGKITMANGAQDPWNTQYHGAYISAEDGMDRGAIVMYSNGANQKFGSEHDIANGVPTVIVPGNNKDGADDYSLVVCYTYTNGYGEVGALTTGFSNNQAFLTGNGGNVNNGGNVGDPGDVPDDDVDLSTVAPGLYASGSNYKTMTMSWQDILDNGYLKVTNNGMLWNGASWYNDPGPGAEYLIGDLVLPNDGSIKSLADGIYGAFGCCYYLTNIILPDSITTIGDGAFYGCYSLEKIDLSNVTVINDYAFQNCSNLSQIILPENLTSLGSSCFQSCFNLVEVVNLSSVVTNVPTSNIGVKFFNNCTSLSESKLIFEDGLVWYNNDGEIWLVNDLRYLIDAQLPDDYHGAPYHVHSFIYVSEPFLQTLTFGKNTLSINMQIAARCKTLKTITLPTNAVIDRYAFLEAAALTTLILPSDITTFDSNAIGTAKTLISNAIVPPTIVGQKMSSFTSIYVPAESLDAYKTAEGWSAYATVIQPIQ